MIKHSRGSEPVWITRLRRWKTSRTVCGKNARLINIGYDIEVNCPDCLRAMSPNPVKHLRSDGRAASNTNPQSRRVNTACGRKVSPLDIADTVGVRCRECLESQLTANDLI